MTCQVTSRSAKRLSDDTSMLIRGEKYDIENVRKNGITSAEIRFNTNKPKLNTTKTQILDIGTTRASNSSNC